MSGFDKAVIKGGKKNKKRVVTENVAAAKNTEKLIWFHGEAEAAFSGGADGDLRARRSHACGREPSATATKPTCYLF